eukprot:bmy_15459T0
MIIYRDLMSRDEMCSDTYKIREVADRLCLEVEGGDENQLQKRSLKEYIKDYMKSAKGKLGEQGPERFHQIRDFYKSYIP